MPGYEVIGSEELAEVQDVFAQGGVLFRHGFDGMRNDCYKVRQFEKEFANQMGIKYALAVTSGTAALRVALAALDIGLGDEVITQSFTFVATVEGIIESRATPVCAEIDTTLNLDPVDLRRRITPRTKAVIVVHMLGTPARLPEIDEICRQHKLILIEDTAWGCGGNFRGTPLGTWGDIGTYSFDFAKTMTTGEGGMIVFRDEAVWKKATAWHDHGHENNPSVQRWEDTRASSGFNYRMMELQGAVGLAQLKKLSSIVDAQRSNRKKLWLAIADLPGIELRIAPDGSYETADALVFFVANNTIALSCREHLLEAGLATKILPEAYTWHFAGKWQHMPELQVAHGGNLQTSFPQSEAILSRAVSIPVGVNMADDVPAQVRYALEKGLQS
jgi:8-amino-3,8-dideoxy-alpha-D-manno-octulosonate transaminase